MKKMLTIAAVCALALVIAVPTFAATENLSFGGSIQEVGYLTYIDKAKDPHFNQAEVYLWATADLADNVMAKISLKYQNNFGTTSKANGTANITAGNIALDEAYIKLGKVWESPVSVTIGRWKNEVAQEKGMITDAGNRSTLIPLYGEGFIIPNNNSVDGVKAQYDGDKWWVDALWFKNTKGPVVDNSDNTLYGAYGQYKGFEDQLIDAYILWNDNNAAIQAQTIIAGARADGKITQVDGLGYKAEIAYTHTHLQLAVPHDEPDGFGGYAGVNYTFKDIQYCPAAHLNFYYLEKNFTQVYGHVDQYELGEQAYGRLIDLNSGLTNNAYFFNLGASIKPTDKVSLDGDYYHYNNQRGNSVLGHELDVRLSYQYSENVAAELIGSYFVSPTNVSGNTHATALGLPGDAFGLKGGIKVSF